jgi:predicted ATPase
MVDGDSSFAGRTRLVGREEGANELERVAARNQVVTLVGAPGVGKTRMAREVAGRIGAQFPDGLGRVDLAIVDHPESVPFAVAGQLGIDVPAGHSPVGAVVEFIRERKMLVVLDNCGHLLGACASLLTTLCAASKLTVVTTCPEAIGLAGELIWRVPPLSAADAVELFAQRADIATPGFRITGDNWPVIDQVCRRLAGIPGAIEVAAARTNTMSLSEMQDSILDWFRLFTGSAHGKVRDEHIMLAAVSWSDRLCREPPRALLRCLAVFRGTFSLDAARSIGADQPTEDIDKSLSELAANRLIEVEERSGAIRYRLSQTVREYASAKLSDSGEADAARRRHWRHYTASARPLSECTPRNLTTWDASDCANLLAATEWKRQAVDNGGALCRTRQ